MFKFDLSSISNSIMYFDVVQSVSKRGVRDKGEENVSRVSINTITGDTELHIVPDVDWLEDAILDQFDVFVLSDTFKKL